MGSLWLGLFGILWAITPQGPRGMAPIDASLLLVPGYRGGSAVGPLAGRVADRFGPVLPATAGLSLQVVALLVYVTACRSGVPVFGSWWWRAS